MNGDVGCSSTTTSMTTPFSPRSSSAWATTLSELAVSSANSAGRSMTCAPHSRATAAISGSSVETTTRSTRVAASALVTARATSGMPPTRRRFLRGTPFDPPRAGMTTTVSGVIGRPPEPARASSDQGTPKYGTHSVNGAPRSRSSSAVLVICGPVNRNATEIRRSCAAAYSAAARNCSGDSTHATCSHSSTIPRGGEAERGAR